jgi:hypothetical protein
MSGKCAICLVADRQDDNDVCADCERNEAKMLACHCGCHRMAGGPCQICGVNHR